MTKSKFFEPTRSAISRRESSIGRPSRASVITRLNSAAAGGWPSSTTFWIPCRKLWPALSEAASVISRSGSWFSNAASLRFAFSQTTTNGTDAPAAKPSTANNADRPTSPRTIPPRRPAANEIHANSAGFIGRSARSSRRRSERQWRRLPNARSVTRSMAATAAMRSSRA